MIEGQLLEIEGNGDLDIGEEDHLDIIRRKTADLFSACLRIGAMLASVGERKEEALARYGLNLGICFQMVDDLLDFTADEKVLGKPVASDLREGKLTLPVIYLLRRGGRKAADLVQAVLTDRGFSRVSREQMLALAHEHGVLEECRALAERYAELARQELTAFEPSPYTEALEILPDFILARDH
jgi:octaprenyl-diphosphate synthase